MNHTAINVENNGLGKKEGKQLVYGQKVRKKVMAVGQQIASLKT